MDAIIKGTDEDVKGIKNELEYVKYSQREIVGDVPRRNRDSLSPVRGRSKIIKNSDRLVELKKYLDRIVPNQYSDENVLKSRQGEFRYPQARGRSKIRRVSR